MLLLKWEDLHLHLMVGPSILLLLAKCFYLQIVLWFLLH